MNHPAPPRQSLSMEGFLLRVCAKLCARERLSVALRFITIAKFVTIKT